MYSGQMFCKQQARKTHSPDEEMALLVVGGGEVWMITLKGAEILAPMATEAVNSQAGDVQQRCFETLQ